MSRTWNTRIEQNLHATSHWIFTLPDPMYNQPSHEMKCESMPIIVFITSIVKDLKNFTNKRFGSRFIWRNGPR